ncbi:MAG: hypothetical protein ACE5FP_07875, partial [Gemmatimonadota bacterium]
MLTRSTRSGVRLLGLMLATLVVGSCLDDNLPSAPDAEEVPPAEGGSFAVTCEANVEEETLGCGPQGSSSPRLTEGSAA